MSDLYTEGFLPHIRNKGAMRQNIKKRWIREALLDVLNLSKNVKKHICGNVKQTMK